MSKKHCPEGVMNPSLLIILIAIRAGLQMQAAPLYENEELTECNNT